MVTVDLKERSLDVSGHAPRKYREDGNAVCAAVSALTLTAMDALTEVAGLTVTDYHEESGHVTATWSRTNVKARAILAAYALGLRRISESYPGTVDLMYSDCFT